MKKFLIGLVCFVAVVSVIGNVLLYMRYSTQRPLIEVNSDVIRQKDLNDRLDYLYSNNVLRNLIITDVVMQAAKNHGVAPTDADVQQAKDDIERKTPQVVEQARQGDPNLEMFDEALKTRLALRSLRVQGIEVSDVDARSYYDRHKSDFLLPQQTRTVIVVAPDSIGADTAERLLQNNVAPQIIAGQSGLKVVGMNTGPVGQLPASVSNAVLAMKLGEVKRFPVGSGFIIVKVKDIAPAQVPPFEQVRDKAVLGARLAKAPSDNAELARLLQAAQIKVESDKYSGAVPQVGQSVASAQ